MKYNLLALVGALAGGTLGYFVFFWMVRQGLYALILPGALVGLGAGLVLNRSVWVAVMCGLLAIALGLFIEFRFAPFAADESFGFFLANLRHKEPVTLGMIVVGGFIGFWIPFRRRQQESQALET